MNLNDLKPGEFKDFVEDSATLATGAKIYSDGIQYVDSSSFWGWIKSSYPKAMANGIGSWVNDHYPDQAFRLLQSKGLEWDAFRDFHPQLFDINKLSPSSNTKFVDFTSINPFDGNTLNIQVKASLKGGIYNSVKEMLSCPIDTKFIVNQSVYDQAVKQGIPNDRFLKVVPDNQVTQITDKRLQDVSSGSIDVDISTGGVLNEVGKGALIGAVLYVGVSAISNYRKYKSGQMSYNDFANRLLKDGTKGGIMGGTMASVNVGVQWSLVKLGLGAGNPIAIPVLIVISYGLKKIIDPMFKDGSYAETLQTMQYYEDFGKGWLNFGKMSEELYKNQKVFLSTLNQSKKKSEILNTISSKVDDNLNNLIEEI